MKIGPIDLTQDVMVIAEVGNNHEGDYALAQEMIRLAAQAGGGAVKFQTIVPERLVSVSQTDRIQQLKRFQFTFEQFEGLAETARENGILFLSTPFDLEAARFLNRLVPAFKIASGDNNFYPLLECVAETGKPILMSTGLADLDQVRQSQRFIEGVWKKSGIRSELALLHCVSSYPTAPAEANLRAIRVLETMGVTPGYSDHTLGIEAAVLSVALGARIVEKHFTINKNHSSFRDHQLSADPAEMAELVRRIREASALLGSEEIRLEESERANRDRIRRSIAAARDLRAGETLAWKDLVWVRPGEGLAPGNEHLLLGRTLRRAIAAGDMIRPDDVGD